MNERQKIVCAIALFADGWTHQQIATALGVTEAEASTLTNRGADEQSSGTMGYMKQGQPPYSRDGEGD